MKSVDVICYVVVVIAAVLMGAANIGYWVLGMPMESVSNISTPSAMAAITATMTMLVGELIRKLKPTA